LIDENNSRIGAIATAKALEMARAAELDLVQVDPKGNPPVAKIMDYGQFKYDKEKQAHRQKVQQKKADIKVIRLSPRISQHDFSFRLDQAKKFLERGDKLKIEMALKGRERQHPEKAVETINNFLDALRKIESLNIIKEQDLTKQFGRFTIILANKS